MELQRAREQEEKKLKEAEEEIQQVVEETLECSMEETVMAEPELPTSPVQNGNNDQMPAGE